MAWRISIQKEECKSERTGMDTSLPKLEGQNFHAPKKGSDACWPYCFPAFVSLLFPSVKKLRSYMKWSQFISALKFYDFISLPSHTLLRMEYFDMIFMNVKIIKQNLILLIITILYSKYFVLIYKQ